ncbi:hypothetical protein FOZ62_031264 [Perkinsus olseni]|uniref:Uncharacterized protein n=1 Tax=Perkinsus olseni TaxID=32597 RepID=A0A7J6QHB0_PEROL|nr:hypothetical protein FOZ62_031264 [Perkinsus olseni]
MNSSLRIAAVAGHNGQPTEWRYAGRVALRGASADTVGSKRYDERCRLLEEEKDGRGALIEDPPPPGSIAVALSGKYPKSCLSFIVLDSPRVSLEAEVARVGPYPPQDMFVVQVENGAILLLAFPECTRAVFVADAASPESPLLEELEESPWLRGESASLRAVLADGELMVYEDGVYVVDSLEGASRLLLSPPEDGHIIENAAFAPDISVLAIVCAGRISVYSYEGFVERLVLLCSCTSVNGGKNGTTFCEFSPIFVNGQQEELLVVGTFLGTLEVYSVRNKKTIEWKQTVTLRKSEVSTEVMVPESICFTRMTEDDTGVYAFVGSRDGNIFHLLLDGRGLTCLGRVQGGPSGCSACLAHIETRDGDDVPIALFKNSSLAVLCEYSTKVATENSSASEGGEKKPEEVGFSVHPVPLGLAPLLVGEIGPNGRVAVVATTALPDGRPYIVIGNIDDDIMPCATFNYKRIPARKTFVYN